MFSLSTKSITLLLSVGVASATGSKPRLRHRRAAAFNHGHDAPALAGPDQKLRKLYAAGSSAASPSESEDTATAQLGAVASARPSLALDKDVYLEGEPITVTFSVGSPSHPYYSSSEAPSLAVDYDYPKYSVGLFMRDADPQGGALAPIVSISACGALGRGCDADDRDHASYGGVSVTFGEESLALMDGRWPLEVASYGTGFDAYVLDGRGAAALGPLGFYIEEGDGEDVDTTHEYSAEQPWYPPEDASSSLSTAGSPIPSRLANNPLLKYQKGILKAPEHQHASVSKGVAASKAKTNVLEVDAEGEGAEISPGTIESGEEEYEADAPVSIEFSVPSGEDLSGYKIGIFMRMAHPQGGALSPVVSLPLCPEDGSGSCDTADNLTTGSVTFSSKTMDLMTGSPWPIDVSQWGTGFDAYILDSTGDGVVGPAKFNIVVDDTY